MKAKLLSFLSLFLILISVAIFLGSCWVTATDGQGALVFIVTLPLSALLFLFALLLTRHQAEGVLRSALRFLSWAGMAFLVLFFASVFVPPLRVLPDSLIGMVSKAFQAYTGMTPYAFVRVKHDVKRMLTAELARTGGKEIDLSRLETGYEWDKACVFGPYTDHHAATKALGFGDWNIETYSQIKTSDSIDAFVFVNSGTHHVPYVADIPRSAGDFAGLSGRCFGKGETIQAN